MGGPRTRLREDASGAHDLGPSDQIVEAALIIAEHKRVVDGEKQETEWEGDIEHHDNANGQKKAQDAGAQPTGGLSVIGANDAPAEEDLAEVLASEGEENALEADGAQ